MGVLFLFVFAVLRLLYRSVENKTHFVESPRQSQKRHPTILRNSPTRPQVGKKTTSQSFVYLCQIKSVDNNTGIRAIKYFVRETL